MDESQRLYDGVRLRCAETNDHCTDSLGRICARVSLHRTYTEVHGMLNCGGVIQCFLRCRLMQRFENRGTPCLASQDISEAAFTRYTHHLVM